MIFEYDEVKSRSNKLNHGVDFDTAFDNGESIIEQLDISKLTRPALAQRRVNVDLPQWMIQSLDDEAGRIGVTRQSIIKVWLAERLKQLHA